MRRSLFTACVLAPAAALFFLPGLLASSRSQAQDVPAAAQEAGAARSCAMVHCRRSWMDANLRLNEVQLVGTAESYKLRPSAGILALVHMGGGAKDAQALDFAQPPLAAQLDHDARSLQFDIAYDPQGGLFKSPAGASMAMDLVDPAYQAAMTQPGFKVIHVLDVDYNASCVTLADCLKQVALWSRAHPRHLPITIVLHANATRTPMPGATRPLPFDAAAFDALDEQIRAVFPAHDLITPDQVRGALPTLRQAVMTQGWPRLEAARGKVLFVLQADAAGIAAYQGERKTLEGRAMFVTAPEDSPSAAILAIDDPLKDGARIAAAVKAGFIVMTRADDGTVEARANDPARRNAAFASGAQIVSTDFPMPDPAIGAYSVSLKDNPRAVCGAVLAPEHCVGMDLPRAIAER